MNDLLQNTIEITKAAGDEIMKYYHSSFDVSEKSPDNPVTDADLAADNLLKERLMALIPGCAWLSEETQDNPIRLIKEYVWVVDPLDGTKEFVMGIPEFTVSVALLQQGNPIIGVIYNPATEELFATEQGQGVHYNGKPVVVSTRAIIEGTVVDASRSELKRGEFEPFETTELESGEVVELGLEIQVMGSIAYKMARLSAGIIDATWSRGPKNEWDVCAGDLLIREAGGRCVDLKNRPLHFNRNFPKVSGVIATNGLLYTELVELIMAVGPARVEEGII